MSGVRGYNVSKRARLSQDLFANDRANDVCASALVSQPTMDVTNDIPARWIHSPCKPDCLDDADDWEDCPCVCRFKYFWIIGMVDCRVMFHICHQILHRIRHQILL